MFCFIFVDGGLRKFVNVVHVYGPGATKDAVRGFAVWLLYAMLCAAFHVLWDVLLWGFIVFKGVAVLLSGRTFSLYVVPFWVVCTLRDFLWSYVLVRLCAYLLRGGAPTSLWVPSFTGVHIRALSTCPAPFSMVIFLL